MKWLILNEKGKKLVIDADSLYYLPDKFGIGGDGVSDVVLVANSDQAKIQAGKKYIEHILIISRENIPEDIYEIPLPASEEIHADHGEDL